jgi:hypothetical protein
MLVLAEDLWEPPRDADHLVTWVSWEGEVECADCAEPPKDEERAA